MSEVTERQVPKVLVVSASSLSPCDATGMTMANLFTGWPRQRIAQVYDNQTPPDSGICSQYVRFSSEDVRVVAAAKRVVARLRAMRPTRAPSSGLKIATQGSPLGSSFLGTIGDVVPIHLSSELVSWARDFGPEVIYSPLGSVRMMNLAMQLSDALSVPIVPHFMDDWPETTYSTFPMFYFQKLILRSKLEHVLAKAPFALAICEDMSGEFSKRYGKRFVHFMNCVDCDEEPLEARHNSGDVVKFGFVGGMHLNRWESLLSVASALQMLRDRGAQISFEICAPPRDVERYKEHFSPFSVVSDLKSLQPDEVNSKLLSFDILVHVESFNAEDARYTRLSVSTKIPQYMAAGKPIFGYGPQGLSSLRYIESTGGGSTVGLENDLESLADKAQQLVDSLSLRLQLGAIGRSVAIEKHNAVTERLRFSATLASADQSQ